MRDKRELSSFVEDYNKVTEECGIRWTNRVIPMNFKYLKRNDTVEVLDISTRSGNALKRSNIMTIGELFDNIDNLSKFRNLGQLSVKDIKTRFCEYYYAKLSRQQKEEFWQYAITENERRKTR